jgi:ABC-type multidrug transport system ATPase subunit
MGDGFANETHRLSKRYGDQIVAVDELDPWVRRSEAYAYLGPNGAGKPTRLRMLLGLVRPTTGTASVLGAGGRRSWRARWRDRSSGHAFGAGDAPS